MSPTDDNPTTITGRWTDTEGIAMSEPASPPSFNRTYKRVDDEPVDDTPSSYHRLTTSLHVFDYEEYPVELVEETWTRTAVRTFWHLPRAYTCDQCDEDAVGWERTTDGTWVQVCEWHCLDIRAPTGEASRPVDPHRRNDRDQ